MAQKAVVKKQSATKRTPLKTTNHSAAKKAASQAKSADIAQVVASQKRIESELRSIKKIIKREELEEASLEVLAQKELAELDNLEKELTVQANQSVLYKVTSHDVVKASIGTFVGVMGHFAFAKGIELAKYMSLTRAIMLFGISYIMINLILYYSGFRKVKRRNLVLFIPYRSTIIYSVSLCTIVAILLMYGYFDPALGWEALLKIVASLSILGAIGAGAADLVGNSE